MRLVNNSGGGKRIPDLPAGFAGFILNTDPCVPGIAAAAAVRTIAFRYWACDGKTKRAIDEGRVRSMRMDFQQSTVMNCLYRRVRDQTQNRG